MVTMTDDHDYETFDEIRDVKEALPEEAFDISSKGLPTSVELPIPKRSDVLGVTAKHPTGIRPTTAPVTLLLNRTSLPQNTKAEVD
jgi:hypothetical protein